MSRLQYLTISALVLLADLGTKALVVDRIPPQESAFILPGFLEIVHVRNPGAAFGIGAGAESVLVPLLLNAGAVAVFGIVVIFSLRSGLDERMLQAGLHLIIGGAVGNLVDRFRLGYVIDFLDLSVASHHWPAFNLADCAICCGIVLLFLDTRRAAVGAEC